MCLLVSLIVSFSLWRGWEHRPLSVRVLWPPQTRSRSSQRPVGQASGQEETSPTCFHRWRHHECAGVPQIFPGVVLFHSDTHFPRLLFVCSRHLPLEQVNLGGLKGRRFCSFQEHTPVSPRDFPFLSVMYSPVVIYSVEVTYFQFSMLVLILRNLLFFYQTILSVKKNHEWTLLYAIMLSPFTDLLREKKIQTNWIWKRKWKGYLKEINQLIWQIIAYWKSALCYLPVK